MRNRANRLRRWAIVLFALPVCAVSAEELSINEALLQVGLHSTAKGRIAKPRPGDKRYGFTYLQTKYVLSEPRPVGWCIVVEKGSTDIYSKGSRTSTTETRKKASYLLDFVGRATATFQNQPSDLDPQRRMLISGVRFMDGLKTWKLTNQRTVALGDGAVIGESPSHGVVLWVVSGQFCLRVEVSAGLWLWGGRQSNPDFVWKGSSTTRFPGRARLIQKLRQCLAQRESVAVKLARDILASWQQWASKRIGPGPDFKGLYYDPRPYLLTDDEFPRHLVVKRKPAKERPPAERWANAEYSVLVPGKTEEAASVHLYLSVVLPDADKPIDAVLGQSSADFREHLPGEALHTRDPVSLKYADDAFVCMTRSNPDNPNHYVHARRGNFHIKINVYPHGYPHALTKTQSRDLAIAAAQRILNKASGAGIQFSSAEQGTTVELTAMPPALWADGRSRTRLQLTVKGAPAADLPAEFDLEAEGGGRLAADRLTTNVAGVAQIEYTASAIPGQAVVTASGSLGNARVTIGEGGIAIEPAEEGRLTVFAGGASSLPLVVRGIDPEGKPLSGLKVRCEVEETRLPERGTLAPDVLVLDAQGAGRLTYTPPRIDPASGFRRDDVLVSATASAPGQPHIHLSASVKLTIHAGETAALEIVKDGFASPTSIPVSLAWRNSLVRGRVMTRSASGESFPVAFAAVRIRPPGASDFSNPVLTDRDGRFAIPCVGDLTGKEGAATDLPEPLTLPLDEYFRGVLREAGEALKDLNREGLDVRQAAFLLSRVSARMAASDPNGDPTQTPAAVGGAAYRLGIFAVQLSVLYARQDEDLGWLMESVNPIADQLAELLVQTEAIEKAAKKQLGDAFQSNVWIKFRKTTAGRCIRRLNVWLRRNTRTLRGLDQALGDESERAGKLGEAVGLESGEEDGLVAQGTGLLHHAADPVDALTGDLQDALGASDLTGDVRGLVSQAIRNMVRKPLSIESRRHAQGLLNATTGRLSKSAFDPEGTQAAMARARALFADYQKNHTDLNIHNLDMELYRLDTRLFMDTVVKGVFIYLNLRKLAADAGKKSLRSLTREKFVEIQDSIANCGEQVNAAASYLDSAFRLYQGQIWLRDRYRAQRTLDAVAAELTR
jgi:hypothetical protein